MSLASQINALATRIGQEIKLRLKSANNLSDLTNRQLAVDTLTNVANATNEQVLTKDSVTGNAIFKDAAGGSNPLSYTFPLNETISANKIVQLLESGKIEAVGGVPVEKNLNIWKETTFAAYQACDITVKYDHQAGNRFVVTFLDSSTGYYNAVVGTVSANKITFGSKYVILSSNGISDFDFDFCKGQTDRIVVVYAAPTTKYLTAKIGTISGTALSFSSETVVKNTACYYNKIEMDPLNNTKLLVHFRTGNVYYLKVILLESDVLTLTGSNYAIPISGSNYAALKFSNITSNRFLIAINIGNLMAVAGTISGTTITFGSVVTVDTVDCWYVDISFTFNSDKFAIAYRENNYNYAVVKSGYLSGTTVVINPSPNNFNTSGSISAITIAADLQVADNYVCSISGPGGGVLLYVFHDYGYMQTTVYYYTPFSQTKTTCRDIGICFCSASSKIIYIASEDANTVFGRVIYASYSPNYLLHGFYSKTINSQIEFDPFNSNRFIYSYISTYIYIVVGIINTDGSLSFSAACYSSNAQYYSCLVQFSPWEANKFIVAGHGPSGAFAFVGAITNNVPSIGAAQTINSGSCTGVTFALDKLTPNSMAVTFYYNYYGYAIAATIGTSTITFGSAVNFGSYQEPSPVKSFFSPKMAGNWVFIQASSGNVTSYQVSGLTLTLKSTINLGTAYTGNFDVDQNGDYFVVTYYTNASPRLSYVIAFSVINYILVKGTAVQFESDATGVIGYVAFDPSSVNRFFLTYSKLGVMYIREGNINNYVITLNAAEPIPLNFSATNGYSRIALSPLKVGLMLYQDGNYNIMSGYINTTTSNIDSLKIIGVLTQGGVLNDLKKVALMGGIYDGFAGLTIGAKYYVSPSGTISKTNESKSVLLGKALSATCIKLISNI